MVCMYSHWLEAFPYKWANALAVDKILLERTIPTWGMSLELHKDKGTHFTGQILNAVCDLACITFPLCLSSSIFWSSRKTNGIIKTQLAKLSKAFSLRWLKLLPIVLLNWRSIPFGKQKLSPFEIITGRPMIHDSGLYEPLLVEGDLLHYC